MTKRFWHLTRGGETIAILRPDGKSLVPELDGYFTSEAAYEPTPAFESVRHLFDREIAIVISEDEAEGAEWAAIWGELKAPGLFGEAPDGRERWDILWIHFENGRAWWWPLGNSPLTVIRRK
jgi:hypothetical protein